MSIPEEDDCQTWRDPDQRDTAALAQKLSRKLAGDVAATVRSGLDQLKADLAGELVRIGGNCGDAIDELGRRVNERLQAIEHRQDCLESALSLVIDVLNDLAAARFSAK